MATILCKCMWKLVLLNIFEEFFKFSLFKFFITLKLLQLNPRVCNEMTLKFKLEMWQEKKTTLMKNLTVDFFFFFLLGSLWDMTEGGVKFTTTPLIR